MTGWSTGWGRAVVALATLALVAGCGSNDDPIVGPSSADAPATASVSDPGSRTLPRPVDGALRADLAGVDPAGDGPSSVLLFGDSVAVLVADDLADRLDARLRVDGVDCRRLDLAFTGPCGGVPAGRDVPTGLDGLREAVAALSGDDDLPDAAVLVIANNAALHADDLDEAMAILADVPRVWWVTTSVEGRAWRDPNNALLADLARRDDRAGLVDWFAASEGHDWLADHVHPDDAGQRAMAALIADALRCNCSR